MAAFFGENSSKEFTEAFLNAANDESVGEKYAFVHSSDKECAASFGANTLPAVVLFRKFDESPLVFSESLQTATLVNWLSQSSVPTLIEFSEEYIEPIFGQRKAAIILFRAPGDNESAFFKTFTEAAKTLKGSDVLFVESGVTEGIQGRLAEFLGVDESSTPTIRLIDPSQDMKKYHFPGSVASLSIDEVKNFIDDFKAGKLQVFLKSQEIPADDGKALKTVVGKSFKNIVINSDNDVFVKFYAPWCGHCKSMAPAYEQLAEELKDVPGLVIADFDATANEVEEVNIEGFPTLKFFVKGAKDAPLAFEGERDLEGMRNYLKEHSPAYKRYLESKTEL